MYTNFAKICASMLAAIGGMLSVMLLDTMIEARADLGLGPWVFALPVSVMALAVWVSIQFHEAIAIDEEFDRDIRETLRPRLDRIDVEV